jgi:class 3 adenylate cyclase
MLDEVVRGSPPPLGFYSLSGMEQAKAWQQGLLPATPLARLLGYRPSQVGSGSATLRMPASPWLQFGDGTVDFKIVMEEALAVAVMTGLAPCTLPVTSTLSVSHFRVSTVESESLVARARVLNSGSTFTVGEVLVEDALGRAVAHATGAYLVRAMQPPPPPHAGFGPVEEPTYASPDPHLRPAPADDFLFGEIPALEGLRNVVEGKQPEPPITGLMELRFLEVGEAGAATLSLPASPWFASRSRDVTPGPIATLMHMALSTSPLALARAGEYLGVVGQSMTFLDAVPADGRELIARARLAHKGSELLVSSVEVIDADGRRVAMGSQTSVLRERRRRGTARQHDRVLATILFTDIVGSTRRAQELGDERWRDLLAEHGDIVRRQLQMFGGREVKSTGDGFLAAFESPARAVHCARAIRDGVRQLGLEIRAGIHTGECERVGSDLAGIAVHAASRIESIAVAGEILVSATVRDLVAGSGLGFGDRGLHELKGIEGKRQLFAVLD